MPIEELYELFQKFPSVQTDTRKLKKGDLFFALKGENFDGNSFARKAIDAGAAKAIIDDPAYAIKGKTILVDNVLKTLQALSRHHRQQFTIPIIAITGSNGKTTTKELVHAVLSSTFQTYTTEGNLNNHIGVPLTLLKIRKDAEFAVIEMGANHLGEIASYCTYAQPTHGLITNCGKAHLEGFGGVEGVRKAKGELFDYIKSTKGTVFVMWDYDYLQRMSKGISGVIKYGTKNAHVLGRVKESEPLLTVEITQGLSNGILPTQLVGEYNFPNILAAVTIGKFFNVPEEKIIAAITNYVPSNSRSQLIKKNSNTIILDAYNANPSSMKLAIENFAKLKGENKVLLLGGMAELGAESLQEHQLILDLIKQFKWNEVALVGGDFLKLDHSYHSFDNAMAAKQWLLQKDFHDTLLLVKGSRSMQMEKLIEE